MKKMVIRVEVVDDLLTMKYESGATEMYKLNDLEGEIGFVNTILLYKKLKTVVIKGEPTTVLALKELYDYIVGDLEALTEQMLGL